MYGFLLKIHYFCKNYFIAIVQDILPADDEIAPQR